MKNQTKPLSKEQERVLLYKHNSGYFPGQSFTTITALIKAGMLEEVFPADGSKASNIVVTPKGKAYCNANHASMPSGGRLD